MSDEDDRLFHAQQARTGHLPDLSTWLTADEAAAAAHVVTKTIRREAQRGHLQSARRRSPGGGQERTVYHPSDVARLATERQPAPLAPFLVPGPDPSVNGNGHRALAVQAPAGRASSTDLLRGLATLLLAVSEKAGTDRTGVSTLSTLSPDRYYTLAEAAVYTNLTPTYLRRRIQDGTLKAIKDRGWKIRRKDLEQV